MELDEIMILYVGGALVLSCSLVSMRLYFGRRSKLLALFSLSWLSMAMYLILAATASLVESVLLFKINDSMVVTSALMFFMAFLDYAQHDSISPKKSAIGVAFFAIIFTWIWYPSNIIYFDAGNNVILPFGDLYILLQNVYIASLSIAVAYWQLLTVKKAPPSFKKVKVFLAIGAGFALSAAVSVFLSFIPDFSALMFISIIGMSFASTIAIQKERRIVHILPFKVYRLVVTSRNGALYYMKEWCAVDVDSLMIAGMISAINTFAKGALKDAKTGVVSEIKLQKAVLLTELRYVPVNILLLASKASNDLKESLDKFSESFVKHYYDEFYTKEGFALEVSPEKIHDTFDDAAISPMVHKYFSNVPDFI